MSSWPPPPQQHVPPPLTPPPPSWRQPPAPIPVAPARDDGKRRALIFLAALIGIPLAIGVAMNLTGAGQDTTATRSPTTTVATTVLPFERHAAFLADDCTDVTAVRDSLLVGIPDGDQACSDAVEIVLALLDFTAADLQAAATGETVRAGDNQLTMMGTTDGALVGIDHLG